MSLESMLAAAPGGTLPLPPPSLPIPPPDPLADLVAKGYTHAQLSQYTPTQLEWLRANAPAAGGGPVAGVNSPEASAAPSLSAALPDPEPVKAKTKAVLEAECAARGIAVPKGAKKADLEALLAAPPGTPAPHPGSVENMIGKTVDTSTPTPVTVRDADAQVLVGGGAAFLAAIAALQKAAADVDLLVEVTIK